MNPAIPPYPLRVSFAKHVTSGIMAGLTFEDSIGMVGHAEAEAWIAGCREHAERNGWRFEGEPVIERNPNATR